MKIYNYERSTFTILKIGQGQIKSNDSLRSLYKYNDLEQWTILINLYRHCKIDNQFYCSHRSNRCYRCSIL